MTEELVTFETAKLAREKGFDEVCRNLWMHAGWDDEPVEVNAPKDEEMIVSFVALYHKYSDDPRGFSETVSKMGKRHPLRNSSIPPTMFCRPTQDLLGRWLREVHGMNIIVEYVNGNGWWYIIYLMSQNGQVVESASTAQHRDTHELAREVALQHALKLLPDESARQS